MLSSLGESKRNKPRRFSVASTTKRHNARVKHTAQQIGRTVNAELESIAVYQSTPEFQFKSERELGLNENQAVARDKQASHSKQFKATKEPEN